jgi:hypothetical protein
MHSPQLTALQNWPTNWMAGLNLNIPVNTREYFKFTDIWTILYICSLPIYVVILPLKTYV